MRKRVSVQASNFVAFPNMVGSGYSWTLVSRLGQMLTVAEGLFGARDRSYTLLGIEFEANGPRLWYPGNCKQIVIQLSPACLTDTEQACYQLAHETVHLLSPTGGSDANNLEEGLAVWFAHDYLHTFFGKQWHLSESSYDEAYQVVCRLMLEDPTAVLRARGQEPALSRFTPALLTAVCPALSHEAAYLCQRFVP